MADLTIVDLLNKLEEKGTKISGYFGVKGLMEISTRTKRRSGFVKIAINDNHAKQLLNPKKEGDTTLCLLILPWDKVKEVFDEERAKEKSDLEEVAQKDRASEVKQFG